MSNHPTLTDGDPEARNVGAWSLDDILETAETLAVWHEDQHAVAMRRCDSGAVVEHQIAADLIRELVDRVPPFPLTYSGFGLIDGRALGKKAVVEIAGYRIEWHKPPGPPGAPRVAVSSRDGLGCGPRAVLDGILTACERAHDRSES